MKQTILLHSGSVACRCSFGMFRRVFAFFVTASLLSVVAHAVETRPPINLLDDLLRRQVDKEIQGPALNIGEAIGQYDLAKQADIVMDRLLKGPGFQEFRRQKEVTPQQYRALERKDQFKLAIEFAQAQEDIKPEIKAWLQVYMAPVLTWDEVFSAYQRLQKHRPSDLLPKLILLAKGTQLETEASDARRWDEWVEIAVEALPLGRTMEEKQSCIEFAVSGAFTLKKVENRKESVLRIWQSIRDISPTPGADLNRISRFNALKALGALASEDYAAGADFSQRSSIRALTPIFSMLAGNSDEAEGMLQSLLNDASLTESERTALQWLAPLLQMAAHRFDEARESLHVLRAMPSPTTEEMQRIESFERILATWEEGVKARQ